MYLSMHAEFSFHTMYIPWHFVTCMHQTMDTLSTSKVKGLCNVEGTLNSVSIIDMLYHHFLFFAFRQQSAKSLVGKVVAKKEECLRKSLSIILT